jgi:hypothetical protein
MVLAEAYEQVHEISGCIRQMIRQMGLSQIGSGWRLGRHQEIGFSGLTSPQGGDEDEQI